MTAAREYQQAARAYNNLGDLYLQSEEFDEAIECFSKCREESTKINHQMMIGWGWFNEGECMIKKGDPKGGIEYCKKALVIVEKLDDRIGTYAVERNLGLGYGLMEDWEESEKHFKRSKEIIEKLDSPFNLGHLLFEMGRVEKFRGRKKKAMGTFAESKKIFEELGASMFLRRIEREQAGL